jgi:hypothetical protein
MLRHRHRCQRTNQSSFGSLYEKVQLKIRRWRKLHKGDNSDRKSQSHCSDFSDRSHILTNLIVPSLYSLGRSMFSV